MGVRSPPRGQTPVKTLPSFAHTFLDICLHDCKRVKHKCLLQSVVPWSPLNAMECMEGLIVGYLVRLNSDFRDRNYQIFSVIFITLGPAYNQQIDAKKTACCRRVLIVTKLFNIAVNDFDANKSTRCRWVLVVTEFVVSGTQCTFILANFGKTYIQDKHSCYIKHRYYCKEKDQKWDFARS